MHFLCISLVAHNFPYNVTGEELCCHQKIPKVTNKCHALEIRTLMKDQSATSLNLHVSETLGVIRQLLILLQNQMGVVRIKDELINRLV